MSELTGWEIFWIIVGVIVGAGIIAIIVTGSLGLFSSTDESTTSPTDGPTEPPVVTSLIKKFVAPTDLDDPVLGYIGTPNQSQVVMDATTVIIGGAGDNGEIGAVWIWNLINDEWVLGQKLVPDDLIGTPVNFGYSLSLFGNDLIIGGQYDNEGIGAAWYYKRTGIVWAKTQKLVPSDPLGISSLFGISCSLGSNRLIVGGQSDNNGIGAAWYFTKSGSTWTQIQKIIPVDALGEQINFGASVSMVGTSAVPVLAIGGTTDNDGIGAVWTYELISNAWVFNQKLIPNNLVGNSFLGWSICINSEGNKLVIGGPLDDNDIGAVWYYTKSGSTWTQIQKIVPDDTIGPVINTGVSVSIVGTGTASVLMFGSSEDDDDIGAAWTYKLIGGAWILNEKIIGPYIGTGAAQGSNSYLLNNHLGAFGGPKDGDGIEIGAVWLYQLGD